MDPVKLTQIQRDALNQKMALDDAAAAMKKLADGSRHIKATQEALKGLSGAIQTANGTAKLLGLESDNLAHVQQKLKAAVELTGAAQQVADTVNKNSYFNLVIVNNAKKALAATNTFLARTFHISATAAKALTGALTMGLSVAVSAAIVLWDKYMDNQAKAAEKAREQAETERQANAVRLQTRMELDSLMESIEDFNGTREQEKKKIDELNGKYGQAFGQYNSLAEWYKVLAEKGGVYTQMLFQQAKAQSLINKAVEADAKVNEIMATPESEFGGNFKNSKKAKAEALRKAEADRDAYINQAQAAAAQANQMSKEAGLGDYSTQSDATNQAAARAASEKARRQAEEEQKKRNEMLRKLADDELRVRQEIEEKLVAALKEGDENETDYANRAFDEEMNRIEQQRQQRLAQLEEARQAGVEVDPEKEANIEGDAAKLRNIAVARYNKELLDIEQQRQNEEQQARNNYLKEYGDYEQQLQAIRDDYARQRQKATTQGERDTLSKKEQEAVDALNSSMLQKSEIWTRLFEDADKHTGAYLQNTINLARQLLDYVNGVEGAKLPEGISEDVVKSIKPAEIKSIMDNVQKQSDALSKKNPFVGLINGFKELRDAGSDTEKQFAATLNILGNFKDISGILNEVGGAVSKMGGSAGGTMQKVSSVANSTLSLASTGASIGGPWGAAIGGALGLASGLVGVLGADYSEYNSMVQKYDVLMDVWDELLNKKKAYIKESYGAEATKAGAEALRLLQSEKEVSKQLAQSRLRAGSSAGSHSRGYRMWKGSSKWNGQNWRNVAGDISNQLGGVKFDGMDDMLNMSAQQLEWIKTNYSGLWSVMDSDFRGYLDQMIQYGDTEKEIIASVKEQLTGVSLSGFQDSFLNLLDDLDSSSEDFADNFEKYLRKSILQSIMAQKYSSQIKALYDSWAGYGEDGIFSPDEVEKLRRQQQQISDAMIAERDKLAETFGWSSDSDKAASSQTGRADAVTTVTEETAGKLEGIGLSIQTHVIGMDEKMADLSRYSYEAIGLLGAIAENTGYCRCLKDIAEIVNRMERDGMKIKG